MTRVGMDVKFHDGRTLVGSTPIETLRAAAELGFEGLLVRTVDEAFPTLDRGDIAAFAAEAERLGMFVQLGLGKVNPYMTAELPRVRDLGDGSYLAGMERMIALCGEYGWTEAWTATGGFKHHLPAPYCFDRFRTDAPWTSQLRAIETFLRSLAPALRSHGVRLNLETHEEITTFEILRLIDAVGEDVLGVCLDPGNLMVRGEPVAAAVERVAPVTHMTHLRDAVLVPVEGGLARFLAPVGDGVVDWDHLLGTLLGAQPDIDLAIEGIGGVRAEMLLQPENAVWRTAHPDMTDADVAELERLAADFPAEGASHTTAGLEELRRQRPERDDYVDFLRRSREALLAAIARRNADAETQTAQV